MERIPNGVDFARFSRPVARPKNVPVGFVPRNYILYLGRLVHRKGVDLLLDAFAQLTCHSQLALVICGDGPERPVLEAQTKHWGLGKRVFLLGQVKGESKAYLLQNAVCTVVPSRISEGFPLVVLESYAAGRPVIGTSVPGLKEAIVANQTGLHVPPESPDGLTMALGRLVADQQWATRLGEHARLFARNRDWWQIADRHLGLFNELLDKKKRKAA
jgi:glycosyltransferase involved in cell wall biosynthesis